jgi:XTP/dITP diphosphohydrolase
MKKILLATNNPDKVEEIRAILANQPIQLLTPAEVGLSLEVSEDGQTYAENATIKALAFAQASGLVSLADDSGLEVEALGGQPGVHSHRYAPWPQATDADRRKYLLGKLTGIDRPWKAQFRATIAIAQPGGDVKIASGTCQGEIIPEERGTNGFGYDPIFFIASQGKTMAELSLEEKNLLSHRARAIRNAEGILKDYLQS